jgi:hypothetical protein
MFTSVVTPILANCQQGMQVLVLVLLDVSVCILSVLFMIIFVSSVLLMVFSVT